MRPQACPGCAGTWIVAHGWYPRGVDYGARCWQIDVRRLKCKGCRKTISLLPSFVHRHRHYGLEVIRQVLETRVEALQPWSQVQPRDGPSARTRRRWVFAFAARTAVWLAWLLAVLARAKPDASGLDPHGSTQNLFRLGRVLADWLEPGRPKWAVVWRHGWNAGVGRLV